MPGVPDAVLRDVSAAVSRATRAGASASQVRRVIELAMVLPVIMAGPGCRFLEDGAQPGDEEPRA